MTQVTTEGMSREQLEAWVANLTLENSKLKAKADSVVANGLSIRVSAKGAVSVYGMGKWPVTLYRTQWERLAKALPDVMAFIELHSDKLAVKAAKEE